MTGEAHPQSPDPGVLPNRYRVLRQLGQGGMAAVYEAVDETNGQRVALKLLDAGRAADSPRSLRQFQVEFHTLTQLAHPRVVAVYDYQKLTQGAFYTMELLEGGDLRERSPLPYDTVCRLLCDICSALALLHSRRLVHRDLTPRNIRCTVDGQAKLIDFGAMVPFGTHRHAVGTPPFSAPEAVIGQPMDGRADLFSLGATAYYALTGRLAFPARTFGTLRNAWRTTPPVPSRIVPGIPPELDKLVMSLISLAPSNRPRSASEVMERLTAVAGIELSDQLRVQSAYLTTPKLVGRDTELKQIRQVVVRAARGRGAVVQIAGAPGVGRSRMADASAMEGKLAGAIVLRVDAKDAASGPWGGVRSMLDQLRTEADAEAYPLFKPCAPLLARTWPQAVDFMDGASCPGSDSETPRAALQEALLALLIRATQKSLLVIVADDVNRLDEPSASLISLLAGSARGHRLVVVTTTTSGRPIEPVRTGAIPRTHVQIDLEALSRADCEALLTSVFGDVANVRLLADRVHSVAKGNPRAIMELAQLLLDRGIVKYRGGEWLLPARIKSGDLPSSSTAAMESKLAQLDAHAVLLAQGLALTNRPTVTLEVCQGLVPDLNPTEVLSALDHLVLANVVGVDGNGYTLAHPGWKSLLESRLEPDTRVLLHGRVAELFARNGLVPYSTAHHLLQAGRPAQAIDTLLVACITHMEIAESDPSRVSELILLLPDDYAEIHEAIIAAAVEQARPRRELMQLKRGFIGLMAITARPRPELLLEVAWELHRDAGLEDFAALEGQVPEEERLMHAIKQAQARWEASPEDQRGYSVGEAVAGLSRIVVQAIGMMAPSLDADFFGRIPDITPLAKLSPVIALVAHNVRGTRHLLTGRVVQAREQNLAILEAMKRPESLGLGSSAYRYMQLAVTYSTGMIEVLCGVDTAIERAAAIEHDPMFSIAAWRLRKIAALSRGNSEAADRCAHHVERLQIQNQPPQMFEGTEAWLDLRAWMEIGDVVRIREMAERCAVVATRYPSWSVMSRIARGRIHELRGEYEAAVHELGAALDEIGAGRISLWLSAAPAHVGALARAGKLEEARTAGARMLARADDLDLNYYNATFRNACALVEYHAGDYQTAWEHTEIAMQLPKNFGGWPVALGGTFELQARIAIATGQDSQLGMALRRCGSIFNESRNPVLVARYDGLVQEAQRAGMLSQTELRSGQDDEPVTMTTAGPVFGQAKTALQRAERTLTVITDLGVGRTAFLYLLRGVHPELVAACGDGQPPQHLDALVRRVVDEELEARATAADVETQDFVTSTVEAYAWANRDGEHFVPAVLGHSVDGAFVISGVIVHESHGPGYIPADVLDQLSLGLAEAGDVKPVVAPSV